MTDQGQKGGHIWLRRINFQNVLRGGRNFSDKRTVCCGVFSFNEMYQNEYIKENLWPVEQRLDGFSLLEKCIRWPFVKTRSHVVRDMSNMKYYFGKMNFEGLQ